ncbi:MAG: sugar phosphate isomerase/epimerase family protein [Bryobacteraceae bacterium]
MATHLLHSVSYAGLWGQAALTVDQFVDKAAELGYSGIMLMAKRPHVSPIDYGPMERAALRAHIEKAGLVAPILAGYCNLTADLDHSEIPHREIWVGYLTELARLAHDLGATAVRVFTGYEHPGAPVQTQFQYIAGTLREAAKRAADFGITLAVQNHHDIAAGYESFYDLLRTINEPNCKAAFDAWAPALHGADVVAAARLLGPLTIHSTIADYQLRPRYKYVPALVNYQPERPYVQAVPMGEGFIDYVSFINALSETGFEGTLAYEMCSPLRDGNDLATLDRYARRYLEHSGGA